ncbi:MAG: 2Fe-2S iron-sulfur cluster binding domain-containing protein [Hydrococcus sp. RU_2_2]|jgi:ferredoxin|nr:2Fe-2S iron-sulfur cluster binding domain-containing protein [Hydrococcus sp. RU_2_2]NJP21747.1 2Fe-2S iron-sulfur cluster binding domain-containing protein [Hydrococcus sp. CRU_1_1]
MTVNIRFLPDDITISAQPGEALLEVAQRAGVFIPTGCLMGSCHACEVELGDGTPICACISYVPVGTKELIINLYDDPVW